MDLTGKQFGRLTVLRHVEKDARYRPWYEAACSCGTIKTLRGDNLTSGAVVSCGCYSIERHETHGMSRSQGKKTSEYRAYWSALNNTRNPNSDYYNQRGIKFRFESFVDFLRAVGRKPPGTFLARIDKSGHYEIGNIEWRVYNNPPKKLITNELQIASPRTLPAALSL